MRGACLVLALAASVFALDESFSDTLFPPPYWAAINLDSGTRCWQRLDIGQRTLPGCAYCGWEHAFLRNFDWLITPQCSVAVGDSLCFWVRPSDFRVSESLEVWISTSTPAVEDFVLHHGFSTTDSWYRRQAYDLGQFVGQRLFFALVYRSLNKYGLLVDDVSGPPEWFPERDAAVVSVLEPGGNVRVGSVVRPSCKVANFGRQGEWVRVSCEFVGLWREETGIALVPGETTRVEFPGLACWQPGCLDVVFATHLGPDQRYWNDSTSFSLSVNPFQSRGGPDSLGYVWFDSDDPLGPDFDWVELYPSGSLLGSGDDELLTLDLAWPLELYGEQYSRLFVCTNGWMSLGPPVPGNPLDSNYPIPFRPNPNRLMAPFWDDLWAKGDEGGIWYDYFGDSLLVIQWHKVRRKGCEPCSLEFEAKLYRGGAVEFHYARVTVGDVRYDGGMSATVGIENASGRVGLSYIYDGGPPGNLLTPGRAIRFMPLPPGVQETERRTGLKDEGGVVSRTILRAPELAKLDCQVVDALGRDVTDVRERLAPGVYFLRPAPGQKPAATRKVIIQR